MTTPRTASTTDARKRLAENAATPEPTTEGDGRAEVLRQVLSDHFVMWHEAGSDGPPGEWRCACGKKFGFSDSAIDHQAAALAAAHAHAIAAAKAEAWDEAIEAVAWCLDNGESSTAAALAYVHKNNRHRATSDVTP